MSIQALPQIACWSIQIVLFIIAMLGLVAILFAPFDKAEDAEGRCKIMLGGAVLVALAMAGMFGVLSVAKSVGL